MRNPNLWKKFVLTTSTDNSGLMAEILPKFTTATGIEVEVIAVGIGKALTLGQNGDVDVVLVYAPSREISFLDNGYGVNRRSVMHNNFVIVGPASDPAGIAGMADAAKALEAVALAEAPFVSRSDDSGTYIKELFLWREVGVAPEGDWYSEAGQGIGAVLTIA